VPIYDYVCRKCGHVLEVIHPVDAAGPRECPVCGGEMRRAVSAPSVHFKGSGWAKKDRSSTNSAGTKKDSTDSAAARTDDAPAKTTDSKPAADSSPPEAS
jgi:putative FmdB family regulatory protein